MKKILLLLFVILFSFASCNETKPAQSSAQITTNSPEVSLTPETTIDSESTLVPDYSMAPDSSTSPDSSKNPESSASPETSKTPESSGSPETSNTPESSTSPETSKTPESSASPETSSTPESSTPEITEPIESHTHSFSSSLTHNSSSHWFECACGEKKDVKPHEFSIWNTTVEPTCSIPGEKTRSCEQCGYVEKAALDTIPHTIIVDHAVPASCTVSGLSEGKHCSVCNKVIEKQNTVPALGHSYSSDWTVDIEATKDKVGSKSHHCIRCDAKKDITEIPATGSVGLAYSKNSNGISCTITGIGTCSDTEIIIPKEISGLKVVEIGPMAFANTNQIKSVIISNTVDTIAPKAFFNCTSLVELHIPDNVIFIGDDFIGGTSSLNTLYYDSSYGKGCQFVDEFWSNMYAPVMPFEGVEQKGFIIQRPDNTSEATTWYGQTNIKKVVFNGPTIPFMFYGNTSIEEVSIGPNVTYMPDWAFAYCSSLKKVSIDKSIPYFTISNGAFKDCYSLVEVDSNSSVGISILSFNGCSKLSKIHFAPTGDFDSFYGCLGLGTELRFDTIDDWTGAARGYFISGLMTHINKIYIGNKEMTDFVMPDSMDYIEFGPWGNNITIVRINDPYIFLIDQFEIPLNSLKNLKEVFFNAPKQHWYELTSGMSCNFVTHCTDGDIQPF